MAKKKGPRSDGIVKCVRCQKAYLMQQRNNPIISECDEHGRQVANCPRVCKDYIPALREPQIHEMIWLNLPKI